MIQNPSLQQVDMLELNLYPNMIYHCLSTREYRQEDRQHINQDFMRHQMETRLKESCELIQTNLLTTVSKKMTDEEKDRLQMLLVDHLECCCSIHLSKIKGDKNELNKEALSVSKNFPKNMIKVMNRVINDFNGYLINKRHNKVLSPGQAEFKQLISYVTDKLEGELKAYMLAAIYHCHARWLQLKHIQETEFGLAITDDIQRLMSSIRARAEASANK